MSWMDGSAADRFSPIVFHNMQVLIGRITSAPCGAQITWRMLHPKWLFFSSLSFAPFFPSQPFATKSTSVHLSNTPSILLFYTSHQIFHLYSQWVSNRVRLRTTSNVIMPSTSPRSLPCNQALLHVGPSSYEARKIAPWKMSFSKASETVLAVVAVCAWESVSVTKLADGSEDFFTTAMHVADTFTGDAKKGANLFKVRAITLRTLCIRRHHPYGPRHTTDTP
jgi:hypothetical protein